MNFILSIFLSQMSCDYNCVGTITTVCLESSIVTSDAVIAGYGFFLEAFFALPSVLIIEWTKLLLMFDVGLRPSLVDGIFNQ